MNLCRISVTHLDTGMRRAGIEPGVTVTVDCLLPLKSGKIAWVKINDALVFRRFMSDGQGTRFEADDVGFSAIHLGPALTFQVIGIATNIEKPL